MLITHEWCPHVPGKKERPYKANIGENSSLNIELLPKPITEKEQTNTPDRTKSATDLCHKNFLYGFIMNYHCTAPYHMWNFEFDTKLMFYFKNKPNINSFSESATGSLSAQPSLSQSSMKILPVPTSYNRNEQE